MECFTFVCKECGKTFSLSAYSHYYALRTLAHWNVCPVGNHACLISMLECSSDKIPVPSLDTTTK